MAIAYDGDRKRSLFYGGNGSVCEPAYPSGDCDETYDLIGP